MNHKSEILKEVPLLKETDYDLEDIEWTATFIMIFGTEEYDRLIENEDLSDVEIEKIMKSRIIKFLGELAIVIKT